MGVEITENSLDIVLSELRQNLVRLRMMLLLAPEKIRQAGDPCLRRIEEEILEFRSKVSMN
jgi:hypothetical protein